ncbi:Pheromone alpha factor receptor [Lachnellula suecica]|uniref:Pheromone alpha factor receptor n=1 Tax=Lachnellula suecica TaxID=602035 RepID=A0A8T9CBW5_9HELO|nr:Pheromone alpha factor receptor [Lachnellula suecica]
MNSTSSTADFNPYTQNITFLLSDGITPYSVSLSTVDYYRYQDIGMAISFGAQFGACILMLFCILLLTTTSKRWSVLFNLNLACLFTGFLSRLFLALFYLGTYEKFYTYFSPETPQVPTSDTAVSIISAILPIFLTVFVNLSLLLQAHTVLKTVTGKPVRYAATFFSSLVFLNAMGWRFAESVLNVRAIVDGVTFYEYTWLINGSLASETVSIWYFSVVFTTKLFVNIVARRHLNQPSWSKMEVITVMGLGTMVIPSIFAIVEWIHPDSFPQAGSLTNFFVIVLLPLSSLWASVTPNSPSCSLRNPGDIDSNQNSANGSKSFGEKFGSISTGISSKFTFKDRRKSSVVPSIIPLTSPPEASTGMLRSVSPLRRDSTEMDLERLGIRVERSYSIHSARD